MKNIGLMGLETMVANACLDALQEHLSNPWRWPRESDLVSWLVNQIHASFGNPPNQPVGISIKDHLSPHLAGRPIAVQIPCVRTEAKILNWKMDICVQPRGAKTTIFVGAGGDRDVVLRVDPEELEQILEVKLNPGRLYTYWVDDLIKLHQIQNCIFDASNSHSLKSLHALYVDTSLPLASLSVTLKTKKAKQVPVWPLKICDTRFKYPTNDPKWQITLEYLKIGAESDPVPDSHIYLWAIGLDSDSETYVPGCWKVDVELLP